LYTRFEAIENGKRKGTMPEKTFTACPLTSAVSSSRRVALEAQ